MTHYSEKMSDFWQRKFDLLKYESGENYKLTAGIVKRLTEENYRLAAQIERLIGQWERQKELFPELSKDGWMDLEVHTAKATLKNIKNFKS